ncbi:hypothetical protein C8Q78DRAFT_1010487 [Trametes maxima]|nr:hypothetical protein C8Q78DRAFT_1010487 [Trametes maxima]
MHEQGQLPLALKRADASASSSKSVATAQPPSARPQDKGNRVDTSGRAPPPPPPTSTKGTRPPPVKVPSTAVPIDVRYVVASSELSVHSSSSKAGSSTTGSAPRTPSASSSSTPKKKRDISFTPVRSTITPITTPDPSPSLHSAPIPPSPPRLPPSFDPFSSTPSRYHGAGMASSKAVVPVAARSHGKPMSEEERAGWDRLHLKTVAITEMLRNRRPYTRADAQASNAAKDKLMAAALEATGAHGPVASGASSVTTMTTTTTTTTVKTKTKTTTTTTTTTVQAQSTKLIGEGTKPRKKLEGVARSPERLVSGASSASSTRATVSDVLPLDDTAHRSGLGSSQVGAKTSQGKSSQPPKATNRAVSPKPDTRKEVKAVPTTTINPAFASASTPRPTKQSSPSVVSTGASSSSRSKATTASPAAKSAASSSTARTQVAPTKKAEVESSKGKAVVSDAPSLLRSVSSPTSKVHSSVSGSPSASSSVAGGQAKPRGKSDSHSPVVRASSAPDGVPTKAKAREAPAVSSPLASSSRPTASPSTTTSSRPLVVPSSVAAALPPVKPSPPVISPPPVAPSTAGPPRPPIPHAQLNKEVAAPHKDVKPPATQKLFKTVPPKPPVSKPTEELKQAALFLTRDVTPRVSVAPVSEATRPSQSRVEAVRAESPASARSHLGRSSSVASIDSHRSKADGGKASFPPPSPRAERYREGLSMTSSHASTAHSELSTRTMSTKDSQRTPRGSPALARAQPLSPSSSSHRSGTSLSRSEVGSIAPSTPALSTYSASIAGSYVGSHASSSHASSSHTISSASSSPRKEGTPMQASDVASLASTRSTAKSSSLSVTRETPKRDPHAMAKTVVPKATPRLSDAEVKAARRATPMPGTIPSPSTSLLGAKKKPGPSTPTQSGPSTSTSSRPPVVPPPVNAAKAGKPGSLTSGRSSIADSVSPSTPPVKEVASLRHQARVSKADTVFSNAASIYELPPPLPRIKSPCLRPAEKPVSYTGKERASDLTPTRSSFASLDSGAWTPIQEAAATLQSFATLSSSAPRTTPAVEDSIFAHSPFSYKLTDAFEEDYSDEEDDEVYLSQPDPLAFLRLEKPLPRAPARTSTIISAESLAKLDEAIDRLRAFAPKPVPAPKATKSAMKPRISVASCALGESYAVILPRHLEGMEGNVPGPSKAPSTSANHVRFVNFPNRSESTIGSKADGESSEASSLSGKTRMSQGVEVPVEQPPRYSDLSPLAQGNFAGSSTTLPLRTTRPRSQSDATAYGPSALRHAKSTPFLCRSSEKLRQLKENRNRYPPMLLSTGEGSQSTTSFGTVDSRPSVRWLSKEEPANQSAVSKVLRKGKNVLGLGKKVNRDPPAPPVPAIRPVQVPAPVFRPLHTVSEWPPEKPTRSASLKK